MLDAYRDLIDDLLNTPSEIRVAARCVWRVEHLA